MQEVLLNITEDRDMFFLFIAVGVGGGIALIVAVVGIIFGTLKNVKENKEREITRREIAAYVAEGSMTPEQGEKLMASGSNPKNRKCS